MGSCDIQLSESRFPPTVPLDYKMDPYDEWIILRSVGIIIAHSLAIVRKLLTIFAYGATVVSLAFEPRVGEK